MHARTRFFATCGTLLKYPSVAQSMSKSVGVTNIKVSFKVNCENLREKLLDFCHKSYLVSKTDCNFFVVRPADYVYIVFYSGHVNCTKIKDFNSIEDCQKNFKRLVEEETGHQLLISSCSIDNISATGSLFSSPLSLFSLGEYLRTRREKFRYCPQRFPGLSVRIHSATFIVFTSGKYIAVGSKTLCELNIASNSFSRLIQDYGDSNDHGHAG